MKILFRVTALIYILFISKGYSQYNPSLLKAEQKVDAIDNESARILLKKIDTTALSLPDMALYVYIKARIFDNSSSGEEALKNYIASKTLFKEADSLNRSVDINLDIAFLLSSPEDNKADYLQYITEYLNYYSKTNNPKKIARGYSYLAMYKDHKKRYTESLAYYKQALNLISGLNERKMEASFNNNIATIYNEKVHKPDSALLYLEKNTQLIADNGNTPNDLYYNYVNKASSYRHLKQYNKAIELLKLAEKLPIKEGAANHKELVYDIMHLNYADIKDYKNAYKYLYMQQQLADSINFSEENIAIGNINTKYQTLEKELENRDLKENNKINRILVYTLIGLLIATFVIGLLIIKNANRKEKISLQHKLIEQQRFDKALKDYELSSIDIMLQGQEKERQRIANDLHDNLGSMLATLKLNFENLKMRKIAIMEDDNRLFEKTDGLIEEAYQKVRRLAHAKNAGVFANEGLIPAIKKLAAKISIPGKLQINVIPFGFTDRLDNTLEIAIFRIVQELATNIIKHSKATEATIHLTQHDDNINIIIEDNGVGMDTGKISLADGMGLHSITKKAEQLEGTLTIDSTPGRGTTIILDLPI